MRTAGCMMWTTMSPEVDEHPLAARLALDAETRPPTAFAFSCTLLDSAFVCRAESAVAMITRSNRR